MKKLLCIVFLLIAPYLFAENFYKVKLASVYDGDTFRVYLSCRYPLFCKSIPIRIAGIDAPEIRASNACEKTSAYKAKNETKKLLTGGTIFLRNCKRGKYFRLVCNVAVRVKEGTKQIEIDVAQVLLAKKLAVEYDGGTKKM